ncbi:type VI secretion system PAAR protein [Sessilibacter corallicola]|uniref:type VI secretion system PAAR protein n=1 Tax=Sessilibacter corallicola TaxID=2904075 RepID=UPI001E32593B|nr:type VI secretion system PAAR protein [Sessilibacter corallicola]MCE2029161.1 type VI secretion system PAAR protein [Sessilibacter corallicola]
MGSKSRQPAGRLGDTGSNHGAWPPTPIISGSGDVLINGKPAARKGDSLLPHAKPKSPPHGRSISEGSGSVYINGRPAARVLDAISCGGLVCTGSGNVLIGDDPQLEKVAPLETYVGEFILYKTDNRPFEGYYYEIRSEAGSLLGYGTTDALGYTERIETDSIQRITAYKSIMRESERITEDWQSKLDAAVEAAKTQSEADVSMT